MYETFYLINTTSFGLVISSFYILLQDIFPFVFLCYLLIITQESFFIYHQIISPEEEWLLLVLKIWTCIFIFSPMDPGSISSHKLLYYNHLFIYQKILMEKEVFLFIILVNGLIIESHRNYIFLINDSYCLFKLFLNVWFIYKFSSGNYLNSCQNHVEDTEIFLDYFSKSLLILSWFWELLIPQ